MTLWPVVLDTQVPWSLHMVHYCIYYYLALILLYTTNNQSHSINTVVCGLRISSYSLTLNLHVLTVEIALLYGQIDGELCSGWYKGDITPGELFPLHS